MTSAEKFEFLSAYLDDEASQAERRLVEQWIECDSLFRQQYQAQLRLKSALRSLPASLFDVAIAAEAYPADTQTDFEQTASEPKHILRKPRRYEARQTFYPHGSSHQR